MNDFFYWISNSVTAGKSPDSMSICIWLYIKTGEWSMAMFDYQRVDHKPNFLELHSGSFQVWRILQRLCDLCAWSLVKKCEQDNRSMNFESKLVDSGDHTWHTWSRWRRWRFEAVPRSGCECLAVKAPEVRVRWQVHEVAHKKMERQNMSKHDGNQKEWHFDLGGSLRSQHVAPGSSRLRVLRSCWLWGPETPVELRSVWEEVM